MFNLINHAKTALLMGLLIGLFILVGSRFGVEGMIFASVFGIISSFGAYFFSDTIAIKAMQGREVTPDHPQFGFLYHMVDDLRQRAELPMPRVYICPHDAPNAFATGRNPKHAAVAVTQGLLRTMDRSEVEGVLAHELAHIRHRDTLISCIAATIAGVLATLAQFFFFFGGRRDNNPLLTLLVVIIAAVGAVLIKAMISCSREFAADAEGARIAGSSRGLASALGKLDALSRRIPLVQPNPAQNNLFIIEPLCGRSLSNLFATHPPTAARIRELNELGF
ncbi:MAG: M48 family metalloprotease [Phycisphaerales bacterium]|nr:M48 family metalloprotease [Phycisphaerales bacterium]